MQIQIEKPLPEAHTQNKKCWAHSLIESQTQQNTRLADITRPALQQKSTKADRLTNPLKYIEEKTTENVEKHRLQDTSSVATLDWPRLTSGAGKQRAIPSDWAT